MYRVTLLLVDLGWVDLDLICYTILLGQYADIIAANQLGTLQI